MAWSNKSARTRFSVEKSHSLSFAVRVEDRLHTNIIQEGDLCWLTVRPVNFVVGQDDDDIIMGTAVTPGNGLKVDAVLVGEGESAVFSFEVQAAALNLDAELEYWYDITYVRTGYSMSVAAGDFEVAANVTNRGAEQSFVSTGDVFQIVSTIDGRNLLNVTSTLPMPQQGPAGTGSYVVAVALSEVVGNSVEVPVSQINTPSGSAPQVGDVLFSSVTRGALATVDSISWTGTPSVVALTRQNYGLQTLKALLDTVMHDTSVGQEPQVEVVDATWNLLKSRVPLPPGYEYRVGDLVFSHCALYLSAITKKMVISLIEGQTATHLQVRTKVVFPMFLDADDISELLAEKADSALQINGHALSANFDLTEDDIGAGANNAKFTNAQKTKLTDLPTKAALDELLLAKAASGHGHAIAGVAGLQEALDSKITSETIDVIWSGTQAQYDAIPAKDNRTQYLIKA